jgi:hypothetical protein
LHKPWTWLYTEFESHFKHFPLILLKPVKQLHWFPFHPSLVEQDIQEPLEINWTGELHKHWYLVEFHVEFIGHEILLLTGQVEFEVLFDCCILTQVSFILWYPSMQ